MEALRNRMDVQSLTTALRKREKLWRWIAVGQIAGGLAATVMMPAAIAFFMVLGTRRAIGMTIPLEGTAFFVLVLVVFMPVAYFLEWQTQGGFLMRRLWEIERSDGGWFEAITHSRRWRWDERRIAAQWEIILFAPRLVFGGIARLRGMRLVAGAESDATAETLGILVSMDHGIEIERLRGARQSELHLSSVISYLMFYDWVGVSENGQKVWALTASRQELGLA